MRHPDFDTLVSMSRPTEPGHADERDRAAWRDAVEHAAAGGHGVARVRAAEHVSVCADCSGTVAWAAGVRAAAAAATSLAAPPDTWSQIESRIERGERMILPAAVKPAGRRTRTAAVAAGLVLLASAGAALVPQTGVLAWLERHLTDARSSEAGADRAAPAVYAEPSSTGFVIQLVDGEMHIELTAPAAPLLVRLRLTDGTDVEVSAAGSAADARFLAGSGTLEIADAAGGEITLLLPRSARLITVDADGVRAVELRSGLLTVHAEQADTIGAEIILPYR